MTVIAGADENSNVKPVYAEKDENDVTKEQTTVTIIHLNYVWDDRAEEWVRMAQWTPL